MTNSQQSKNHDKNVAWYYSDLSELEQPTRDLFVHYAHVSEENVVSHIEKLVNASFLSSSHNLVPRGYMD